GKNYGVMIDTLSRGIDAVGSRLRQMRAVKYRTVLFEADGLMPDTTAHAEFSQPSSSALASAAASSPAL
ncbi:TPA: hypothetical protein ACOENG_004346, partial [Stenotrophomonas maltophilia]